MDETADPMGRKALPAVSARGSARVAQLAGLLPATVATHARADLASEIELLPAELPAVANAVNNALRTRMTSLPLSPPKVLKAIKSA